MAKSTAAPAKTEQRIVVEGVGGNVVGWMNCLQLMEGGCEDAVKRFRRMAVVGGMKEEEERLEQWWSGVCCVALPVAEQVAPL